MSNIKYSKSNTSFNQDIGNWDVSSVTDMRYMFKSATSFNIQDIGKWDVSSVTHMDYLLYEVTSFNQPIGKNWDVSSVTDMRNMFFWGDVLQCKYSCLGCKQCD